MAAVRYIVSSIEPAIDFYRDALGFDVKMQSDGFAALTRDDLTLFLNVPGAGSAGKAGGEPKPGGWSRFQIATDNLDALIKKLKDRGLSFRGEIASAPAGRQILLEDPSGNVIELFERAVADTRRQPELQDV